MMTRGKTIKRITAIVAAAAATAVFGGVTHAAQASTMHRVYTVTTRACHRYQLGADGIRVLDGHRIAVVCERFGAHRFAWDEERWTA